ncbi:hypothetical protein [Paenibacillus amylolyticus]|uniref:hypothetical protein n=1 Tax=Paenibacillus amylolyticus TaxID=1451 RepID=UPI00249B11A8|nr:hypothetical protein [Paenibacillus amylolyticus]WFA83383.1 hypothetical protein OGI70_20450 [Paenibacillus amylolyticus]
MMVLTKRALKLKNKINNQGTTANLENFSDKSKIASYAMDSVATMIHEGMIEGSNNKVILRGNISKAEAEAVVFLYRLYNRWGNGIRNIKTATTMLARFLL